MIRHGTPGLEPFREPDLDDGLAGDANAFGLAVERADHPCWQIHVHTVLLEAGTGGCLPVQKCRNVLALVEAAVEFCSCNNILFLRHLVISLPV
jgi:hypothetical protein